MSPPVSRAASPLAPSGFRAVLPHFTFLVAINVLVGAMVGQERTVLPLLATETFGLELGVASTTFLISFGLAKASGNLAAGWLADRGGRRPVLVAGWALMAPVPLMLGLSQSWGWVVGANALLGAGQGLAWSMTVSMKIDLAGSARRGLAAGANEAAGYLGLAAAAVITGILAQRFGLRPAPFVFGGLVALAGLGASLAFARETAPYMHEENHLASAEHPRASRVKGAYATIAQAGLITNLNDAIAWFLFPLVFSVSGRSLGEVGALVAIYPAVWGLGQLVTGPMSDRRGRRWFVVGGMMLQAAGLALVATGEGTLQWAAGAATLGVGTAMVYPVLIAAVSDVAEPRERASKLGVFRAWRDLGFAVGGVLAGVLASSQGTRTTIAVTAVLTAMSGLVAARWLPETLSYRSPRSTG